MNALLQILSLVLLKILHIIYKLIQFKFLAGTSFANIQMIM